MIIFNYLILANNFDNQYLTTHVQYYYQTCLRNNFSRICFILDVFYIDLRVNQKLKNLKDLKTSKIKPLESQH